MPHIQTFVAALSAACILTLPASLQAQPVLLGAATATLTGAQEVPPVDSPAIGQAAFRLWDDNGNRSIGYQIRIEGIDFGPATDGDPGTEPTEPLDATALHIHFAPPGENGPIQYGMLGPSHDVNGNVTFTQQTPDRWLIEGSWDVGDGNPGQPFADVNAAIAAILAVPPGEATPFYLNAHTVRNPMGEIRGQLIRLDIAQVPEPGALGLLALGLSVLALAQLRNGRSA
ncbi:CHRD domain-containing protein [Pedomonas sp.]|uniref:CHRD domain-containing protein n=1 Tax=Pedomonas sp. TaxID=2976421 RepID=UPI002F41F60B